ncbi:MAG: CRISPR-associated endoribonuclease Cas6 [Candidatus Aminicenantaceae bacterium]
MIGSIVIKLKPLGEIKVTGHGGENLYKLVLNILNEKDEHIAREVHDSKKVELVTVSPLLKGVKSTHGHTYLNPFQSASFRVTYLKEELVGPLINGFLLFSDKAEPLPFSSGEVLIDKVDWQKGNNSIFTSFEEIFSCAQTEKTIALEFCSPTLFYSRRKEKLFPIPKLVFSSLLKKWEAFSEIEIPSNIGEELKKIRVTQFRLKTEHVHFSEQTIPGFMGKVWYELEEEFSKETKKALNALGNFAFYSGIGYKTSLGMGQVRRTKE